MKILHVQPYDHAVSGGVREHVVNLARHQRALGHEVGIIASCSTGTVEQPDVEVVASRGILPIPAARSVARISLSPKGWWRVRRAVRRDGIDVVHVHEPLLPVVAMAATCSARTVTVGTIHGFRPSFVLYGIFRRPLDAMIRRLSARVAVSTDARDWASRYFPGQYHIIPDGVDVARFSDPDLAPVERFDDGRPNVLFVGRLEPRKGFPVLLDAWETVQAAAPEARLLVVGHFDEETRRRWQEVISRRGLHSVEMVGFVEEAELPRYYRSAQVFCAPSTGYEALGIVLLEAMAAGAPIVTTDIEGYRTVVRHGREALVVPPGDPAPLAEGIVTLLRDPQLRRQLSEGGRVRAEEYAWPRLARRLLALYESLGAAGRGASAAPDRDRHFDAITAVMARMGMAARQVQRDSSFRELGLDSLDLAEIAIALERETGARIDDADIAALCTVEDLVGLLAVRLA